MVYVTYICHLQLCETVALTLSQRCFYFISLPIAMLLACIYNKKWLELACHEWFSIRNRPTNYVTLNSINHFFNFSLWTLSEVIVFRCWPIPNHKQPEALKLWSTLGHNTPAINKRGKLRNPCSPIWKLSCSWWKVYIIYKIYNKSTNTHVYTWKIMHSRGVWTHNQCVEAAALSTELPSLYEWTPNRSVSRARALVELPWKPEFPHWNNDKTCSL